MWLVWSETGNLSKKNRQRQKYEELNPNEPGYHKTS